MGPLDLFYHRLTIKEEPRSKGEKEAKREAMNTNTYSIIDSRRGDSLILLDDVSDESVSHNSRFDLLVSSFAIT
jgi:predicted amidophosphoribosyltransferase